jgi:NitT/TauT family transport system substrate-binding protein
MPEGQPTIVHTARRDWAATNPGAVKAFREGVQEGAAFVLQSKNDQAVRAAMGKYIKLPPEVLAKVQISPPSPIVTEKQLDYWVGLMKDQEMLKTNPNVARLIVK